MTLHLPHLLLALGAAATLVAVPVLAARPTGTRIRAGVDGRAGAMWLPRRSPRRLPRAWRALDRLLHGDAHGPVGPGLVATRAETAGVPGLRWRLLHAGLGHRSVAWFRVRQAEVAAACALVCVASVVAGVFDPAALVPLLPLCAVAGYALPLRYLARRAAARRERLRMELVWFLYGLAAFVAAGRPIDRALDRLALREGELAHELFRARELYARGLEMTEALRVLAARCDTEEVREAMSLIAAARGDEVATERVPRMLSDLAVSTRKDIGERRKVQLAYAVIRTTAVGALMGLPVIGIAVLFPVIVQALSALRQ